MKKIFLFGIIFLLLFFVLAPGLTLAWNSGDPIVPCTDNCTLDNFFTMLGNIYSFIVTVIATPLAVVAIAIGGILMMISAGNPNLMGLGKKIFYAALIGLALVWCSYLIIQVILQAIGYTGTL